MSQKNQDYLRNYKNLLDKKINLMTKTFTPVVPVKKIRRPTPEEVKLRVLQSQRLNKKIDDISEGKEDRQKKVHEALEMLHEIGFSRKMLVVRTLGTVIDKMMNQIYTSVNINETSLNKVKATFGHKQVIYLPSHRSYADFMLMSYICFSYNLEIPVIAAGMDFHGMMGMGELLRKTGAFFMRRTFGDDDFYWQVFKEYMREIMTFNDTGLEFFIEGTRSRSCKAAIPRTGLLAMALEPFFMGELHDVTIVPISISYEKPLEEQLFVYELLGIPKPKESTMGFFKAISNLKSQNLGKIYLDFCEPMSVNEYFGEKADRFKHATQPAFVQKLDSNDLSLVTDLGNEVIYRQQEKIVIMSFNLVALIYNELQFTKNIDKLTFSELKKRVTELAEMFETLGAVVNVDPRSLDKDLKETLEVHQNTLTTIGANSNLQLIKANVDLKNINPAKLKGVKLNNEIMNVAVPAFSIQLYCNPTLFWLAQPAFFVLSAMSHESVDEQILRQDVETLRRIFIYEFVLYPGFSNREFEKTLKDLLNLEIFRKTNDGTFELNSKSKFINVVLSAFAPFLNCYLNTSKVILRDLKNEFVEKDVFIAAQSYLEREILSGKSDVHPYSLCLDSIKMVIIALCNAGCLYKKKQNSINYYTTRQEHLSSLVETLETSNNKLSFDYAYFGVLFTSKL